MSFLVGGIDEDLSISLFHNYILFPSVGFEGCLASHHIILSASFVFVFFLYIYKANFTCKFLLSSERF